VKGSFKLAVPLLAALAVAACSGGSSNLPFSSSGSPAATHVLPSWLNVAHAACTGVRIGQAQCDVLISNKGAQHGTSPAGLSATDLEKAYNLPSTAKGKGASVYIVDAYDNPNVASDLAEYRSVMGLPTAKFNKYNQEGDKSGYPSGSEGWGVEIDLDTQMVSASCPNCTVNLIEANSSNWSDLETAEVEAVKLGGTIVTNSYDGTGGSESDYDTKGVTYLASAGDGGLGLVDPATFDSVVAVGGTDLFPDTGVKRGWTETIWGDSGGGCSNTDETKPKWQTDKDCSYRTGNDVSAVADIEVAEYDTYGEGGWFQVGGTSVSSPLIAGMFALAGNSTKQTGGENLWNDFTKLKLKKQEKQKNIYYISQGSDGQCNSEYLCEAGTKQYGIYSGPGGWGSPHGLGDL
jgi:subtilase family serine protease